MTMILEGMPDSSTDYLGAIVDVSSDQRIASGTYRVLNRTEWRQAPLGSIELELMPLNGCGALWTPESGTMSVSMDGDSVRGEIQAQMVRGALPCNETASARTSLHIFFNYARHWWQR
jgi:hypothetical protein